eukprot:CAMPEP_0177715960 /NCGR_PEP_ID=MMETSP0484_2-20121128/14270_1 /TAXON_ID=354590 /ORGANISM="Rhodomonas lens, Strain RHODO" /LENGTH=400 /DNA_ID=CAMNT_0019227989 /DNA_START=65 /DNA_END=1264 /DNA_ORIENTATION=+
MPAYLVKGRVRTLDPSEHNDGIDAREKHIAISGGRILLVGDEAACLDALKSELGDEGLAGVERIDVPEGGVVLPSFHDSHIHPASGGLQVIQCNLRGCNTLQEALATISSYAENMRASGPSDTVLWVVGGGWQPGWFENGTPSKALLDAACPDFPAYLRDMNGHEGWTNSLALKEANIDRTTADPAAGCIVRDENGEPVGHLIMGACRLIVKSMPKLADSRRDKGLEAALHMALKAGITSFHDALVNEDVWKVYLRADAEDRLPIMVHMALEWVPALPMSENLANLKQKRSYARDHGKMIRAETVKIFVDGIPENKSAFMLAPYKAGGAGKQAMLTQVKTTSSESQPKTVSYEGIGAAEHKTAVGFEEAKEEDGGEEEENCCAGKGKKGGRKLQGEKEGE